MRLDRAESDAPRNDWETPRWLFDQLDAEFGFQLDAAASPENALCEHYFDMKANALWMDWTPSPVWCNPPYGRGIDRWVAKAYMEGGRRRSSVVCLLPVSTSTPWWHQYVLAATEIRFLVGRLRFGGIDCNAPFDSVVVVFNSLMSCAYHRPKVSSIWRDNGGGDLFKENQP